MEVRAPSAAQTGHTHVARERTVPSLWLDAVARRRTTPAYLVEDTEGWREIAWDDAAQRVEELANGLLALGVRKGDTLAVLGRTRLEWVLFDFAVALVGGVTAPIYPNSSVDDCAHVLEHSDAIAALAEDDEQRAKLDEARRRAPRVERLLTFDELDELAERGRTYAETHPDALTEAIAAVGPDDLYTYIYTSGTTGLPKGCRILHRNYCEMATCVDRLERLVGPDDIVLLYLPLAHNFGRLMHLIGPHIGFTSALLADPRRAGEVLPVVRPTVVPSVPRVFEKIHAAVVAQFDATTGVRRKLVDWALAVGHEASGYRQRGRPLPRGLAARHRIADRLVYAKVKQRLGGRLRFAISGGAPLSTEIAEFFHALDILILEGYGLTECTTAATFNRPSRFRFGTVGPALPRVELKIDDDGEILIRSETVFAGYHKDEAASREMITEGGWLRSGDIGELDTDGFLRITDRKKDVIVTAGGKNVAPQKLENALRAHRLVSEAVVIGDRRPYVSALVTLDPEALAELVQERGDAGRMNVTETPEVRAAVERIVDGVNRGTSSWEQIRRFTVLPREFSAELGEVTPTLKLKRRVVEAHFAAEIEALYR